MRAARLLAVFSTALVAATVVFVLMRVLPGDPAVLMLGPDATARELQSLRHTLGLDRPLWAQYGAWLAGLAQGQLGDSLLYREPVAALIAERLPVTLSLAFAALGVTLLAAVPLGLLAAVRVWSALDLGVLVCTQAGLAVPSFWVGILLLLVFSAALGWLPLQGYAPLTAGVWQWGRHLLLPTLALGAARVAQLTRFVRGAVLEELHHDYVRVARGKGLGERAVLVRHALRNALIPTVTVAGLQFGYLLGGAIVIEQVFGLPGLGRLILSGIYARDLPLVQAAVAILAVLVAVLNMLVDLFYTLIDPRVELQ